MPGGGHSSSTAPGRDYFATTHWSVVLNARRSDAPAARDALEKLCRAYWYPLYAFVRRQGHGPEDAQDLTQSFFARLLEKNWLEAADRERGRFRSFLLASLKHFLANEWDKSHAHKRGGGLAHVPIDTAWAEERYAVEPAHEQSAERLFERRWALSLLDQVLDRLASEHPAGEKRRVFDLLKPCLTTDKGAVRYGELGRSLGMNECAVKIAVHRLRRRYKELLREAIADTVAGVDEVEDELRHLFAVLAG